MSRSLTVAEAALQLRQGGVIAYPTEAVFGLGCDPNNETAVRQLLAIKQRPEEKGLILVAASYGQLLPFIDDAQLSQQQRDTALSQWPGPVTWLMPVKSRTPRWLTGQFDTLAVRVSAHPIVADLCAAFGGPIVSTSANLTGEPPALTGEEAMLRLGDHIQGVVIGQTGQQSSPSTILDARTGKVIRA
ncbi:L-threonylcarbamoyladenylate synthase [Ferrimonas marina]|uniref:Threonylcarbamoyl-AMP synthase n=1 Tax=Ferrimonas marina TaxID=299255 RepID=A0A1M5ZH31_9GAMM|nr:L-threonylcarbamoyladenylate synthase [Ferrimonas marina]SHI23576.1 L-threonylcarbamoyladenylate synthase [Ferrimonas marina]